MMQTGQEFPSRFQSTHPLHYYFGLNEFVTFSPNAPKEKEDIDNDTRAKVNFWFFLVLSGVFIWQVFFQFGKTSAFVSKQIVSAELTTTFLQVCSLNL
jgi:hypothetical protein